MFFRPKAKVTSKGRIEVSSLRELRFMNQRVEGCVHCDDELDYFSAISTDLENCRFEGLRIHSANFGGGTRQSTYTRCSFDNSRITVGAAGFARFVDCSFRKTNITGLFGLRISMIGCVFSGDLKQMVFYGQDPGEEGAERNEFVGNDFTEAKLVDVTFREGIDLALQHFPSGWAPPDDPYNLLNKSR